MEVLFPNRLSRFALPIPTPPPLNFLGLEIAVKDAEIWVETKKYESQNVITNIVMVFIYTVPCLNLLQLLHEFFTPIVGTFFNYYPMLQRILELLSGFFAILFLILI